MTMFLTALGVLAVVAAFAFATWLAAAWIGSRADAERHRFMERGE